MDLLAFLKEKNPLLETYLRKFVEGLDEGGVMPASHIAGSLLMLDKLGEYFEGVQQESPGTPQAEEAAAALVQIRDWSARAGRMGMSADGKETINPQAAQAAQAGISRFLAHTVGLEGTQAIYGDTPAWHGLMGGLVDREVLEKGNTLRPPDIRGQFGDAPIREGLPQEHQSPPQSPQAGGNL